MLALWTPLRLLARIVLLDFDDFFMRPSVRLSTTSPCDENGHQPWGERLVSKSICRLLGDRRQAMMTPTRAPETDSETTYLPPADREHLTEILVPFGNPALDRRPTDGLHRNRLVGGGALGSFRGCRLKPLSR